MARWLSLQHQERTDALATPVQEAIDKGIVEDRAPVARSLGFTRARVTQLLDLLLLAPYLQEQVLGSRLSTVWSPSGNGR